MKNWKTEAAGKAKAVKGHLKEYKELYFGGAILALTALGAAEGYKKHKRNKDTNESVDNYVEQEEEVDWHDKWLYQLPGQDQNWAMFVSDDQNHNEPDYKEIGRQIAEGEFRVED